jgi:hypothetical protein
MFHGQLRFKVPNTPHTASEFPASSSSLEGSKVTSTSNSSIAALFTLLEANKEELGFEYYSVSQATLDQVFLTIVGKHNVEEENQRAETVKKRHGLFGRKAKSG